MNSPYKMYGKSPMMKALIGKQNNLPTELKNKILASPAKKYKSDAQRKAVHASKSDSPAKMYGKKSPANKNKTVSPKISTKAASFSEKTLKNFRNSVISSSDKSTNLGPDNSLKSETKRAIKNIKSPQPNVPSASSKLAKIGNAAGKGLRVAGKLASGFAVADALYSFYKRGKKTGFKPPTFDKATVNTKFNFNKTKKKELGKYPIPSY